jgi:hypothetical protein
LPARRAGLCCTARASRPASAVGVSSNVGQHEQGRQLAATSPCGCRRTDTRSGQFPGASSASTVRHLDSSPAPFIAARQRPGRSGSAAARLNLWPLSQPALRRRGTEVTLPKPWASTSACCLTLRSAATPHGKPLGRRGTLAYAAPRRPSALPRGSRLAQTLGPAEIPPASIAAMFSIKPPALYGRLAARHIPGHE